MDSNRIFVQYGSGPKEMTKAVLQRAGISESLDRKASYALKPNLVVGKPAETGATTTPGIAAGVIEYLIDCGCTRISIMEGSWVGDDTRRAFKTCGYEMLARRYGISLVDLKRDRTVTVRAGDMELELCRSAVEADFLINLPVLKGHCQVGMTCALKNLKGCIPDGEKRRYHTLGLHEPIARLNTVLRQDLVLVDGIRGDLTFEEGGTPVPMDMIFLGTDPVLIDSFAAELMGFDPEKIPYIRLAAELGAGSMNVREAEILEAGERAKRNNTAAGDALRRAGEIRRLAALVDERNACSACYGGLIHALYRMDDPYDVFSENRKLHIGQGFKNAGGRGIGIGKCTSGFDRSCPGCPPRASEIRRFLRDLLAVT
ncbi:MAG: DUF362 domain-containing protein [Spirochaetia bacterium]